MKPSVRNLAVFLFWCVLLVGGLVFGANVYGASLVRWLAAHGCSNEYGKAVLLQIFFGLFLVTWYLSLWLAFPATRSRASFNTFLFYLGLTVVLPLAIPLGALLVPGGSWWRVITIVGIMLAIVMAAERLAPLLGVSLRPKHRDAA